VELCAFKQHLSILYYLLSMHDDDEGKLAVWCRLVRMARRRIDIDATVAFRTLKLMTEPPPPPPPPPPPEQTEDFDGASLRHVQGGDERAAPVAAPVSTVNATWKRVHACEFEKVVRSQLASNICDDAKVTFHYLRPATRRQRAGVCFKWRMFVFFSKTVASSS